MVKEWKGKCYDIRVALKHRVEKIKDILKKMYHCIEELTLERKKQLRHLSWIETVP